jgi:hypothetical protein
MHRGYKYATEKEISIVHTAKSSSCLRVEAVNLQQQKELKFPPSDFVFQIIKHYLRPIIAYKFMSINDEFFTCYNTCTDTVC